MVKEGHITAFVRGLVFEPRWCPLDVLIVSFEVIAIGMGRGEKDRAAEIDCVCEDFIGGFEFIFVNRSWFWQIVK